MTHKKTAKRAQAKLRATPVKKQLLKTKKTTKKTAKGKTTLKRSPKPISRAIAPLRPFTMDQPTKSPG
jgi:hypothetical protein